MFEILLEKEIRKTRIVISVANLILEAYIRAISYKYLNKILMDP